jgi:hypothetical protein
LINLDENNTIYKILKKHGKFLKTIILEFKDINDTHIFLLKDNIKYININGCQKVSDKGLIHIANNCKNIVALGI